MTDEQTAKLRQLACFLKTAKNEEEVARLARIKVEEKIAEIVGGPEKGQITVDLGRGLKVTVERGFNYRADLQGIDGIWKEGYRDCNDACSIETPPPIKTKTARELDVTGYEWYRVNLPNLFDEIAKHVTVTPKKTAVSVKGL